MLRTISASSPLSAASHAATVSPSRNQKAMSRKARICSSVTSVLLHHMGPIVAGGAR